MASLDQMEGDALEFVLVIAVVLIVAGLILAERGSFGLLNWLKALLQKIAGMFKGLTNKTPGQAFLGQANGPIQSGSSAVTNVTDDSPMTPVQIANYPDGTGGTLLGDYLGGEGSGSGGSTGVVSIQG